MSRLSRKTKWILGILAGIAIAITGGTYVYIHFIEGPPPARLTVDNVAGTTSPAPVTGSEVTGEWRPTDSSQVGYRVQENLFGQSNVATGRTNKVTGSLSVSGAKVTAVDLAVDVATITSDESRRDNQFRGRIMNTDQFPTATFKLTEPIDLGTVPTDNRVITVEATGDLTLHGQTKRVTFELKARRDGAGIRVSGAIPIVFNDYGINNPSFGAVSVEDDGELEMLLVFSRA
jgi:polyisoprenoid-binding protein YceI